MQHSRVVRRRHPGISGDHSTPRPWPCAILPTGRLGSARSFVLAARASPPCSALGLPHARRWGGPLPFMVPTLLCAAVALRSRSAGSWSRTTGGNASPWPEIPSTWLLDAVPEDAAPRRPSALSPRLSALGSQPSALSPRLPDRLLTKRSTMYAYHRLAKNPHVCGH